MTEEHNVQDFGAPAQAQDTAALQDSAAGRVAMVPLVHPPIHLTPNKFPATKQAGLAVSRQQARSKAVTSTTPRVAQGRRARAERQTFDAVAMGGVASASWCMVVPLATAQAP